MEKNKKMCILYDRECIDCGECDRCDLDPQKICDNCGKCLSSGGDYAAIALTGVVERESQADEEDLFTLFPETDSPEIDFQSPSGGDTAGDAASAAGEEGADEGNGFDGGAEEDGFYDYPFDIGSKKD